MLHNVKTQRLRQLADLLENVPAEDFNLGGWQLRPPRDEIRIGSIVLRRGCRFAGCAMGWAAHAKLFNDLKINRDENLWYKGSFGTDAVARVFEIKPSTVKFLFWESAYEDYDQISPAIVSKRLRRFADKIEARIAKSSATLRKPITNSH